MQGVFFLMISILTAANSFILDAVNTSALTTYDFRQLLNLLIQEKDLRNQLENHVSLLEHEIHNNQAMLDSFSQAVVNLTIEHNALMARNKELQKGFFKLTKVSEDRLNSMDLNINDNNRYAREYLANETAHIQAIRQSVVAVELNISALTNDSVHHQQQLSTIESDNQAIHLSVSTNQADISANRAGMTTNRANITAIRAEVASNQAKISTNQADSSANRAELTANITATRADVTGNRAKISTNKAEISANRAGMTTNRANIKATCAEVASNRANISTSQADISSLKQKAGYASAFTAWLPITSGYKVTEPIIFGTVLTNIGSDYNSSNGNFTCQFPGIYMFNLNLYKAASTSYNYLNCFIRKNGMNEVYAYTDPSSSADDGYYETSNSVVVHLNSGDVVSVGDCGGYIHPYSSFTGFLVKSD